MLKIISITIIVLVAGLLAYAAMRPDSIRVERSVSVKAPPEKLYAKINDLKA